MRILSFDWATKKALTVYDSQNDKTKEIPNSIPEFEKFLKTIKEKTIMLFEFGGGETFKLLAFRAGHTIIQIPGKKIRDYRVEHGIEKTDLKDAKTIYDFFINNNGGSIMASVRKSTICVSSSTQSKKGASVGHNVNDSNLRVPLPFYLFKEQNADIAKLKILFREYEDLKKEMVREKLKKIALERRFQIACVGSDQIKKITKEKDISISAKEKQVKELKKILKKKIEQFDIWNQYYKNMKGAGATIIAGFIAELGGRYFENDASLKHFCGMLTKYTKKKGHYHPTKNPDGGYSDIQRSIKQSLFQFTEQIILKRTPKWRELYDNIKIYYAEKHPDWTKKKIDNYAKKFVQTRLIIDFWQRWKETDISVRL